MRRTRLAATLGLGLPLLLLAAGCADLGTEPAETGAASIEFVTYPGEAEPGNVAVFTLVGWLPSPCHDLTEVRAARDGGRVELSARWRRPADAACPQVVTPFEATATAEVPRGFDSLAVAVGGGVWDHVAVLVEAPGFKKGAGALSRVGEVDGAPGCYRGRVESSDRTVLVDAEVTARDAFVVGRLDDRVPEACAGTALDEVLGTLELERIRSTTSTGGG